ncbi:sensor histidine kinase [Glaciecola sp. XM2]|uniref:sensor histidine kinase n=1 Tax=Glaciecola sp. XM2 TaxID=1914931 RepID=UPI001BDDEE88|nr:sensor histidine kinase [Glaciecola sp. XM2]MBT1452463.1 sensor histidine kinase [Glaciecola sp. XM2]
MRKFLSQNIFRLDKASGIVTWLVVSTLCVVIMHNNDFPLSQIALAIVLYLSYITVWLIIVNENTIEGAQGWRVGLIAFAFCIVVGIYFVVPLSFNSILMGILSGGLPYFLTIRLALVVGSLLSVPLFLIFQYYWGHEQTYISALLFWTFNMFAIIMVNTAKKETEAREQAQEVSRRLISTQALLNEANKQSERVRIARNIHDLLGHHLTALTINLQVAGIKSEGEVKQNIEQCHKLAKLLLSDVREAVSEIRDKGQVDLKKALSEITEQIPHINFKLDVGEHLEVDSIDMADALIKCVQESITNTLKHAKGHQMEVTLHQHENELKMQIKNDGNIPQVLRIGNGLKGMQERIEALMGRVAFALNTTHFVTTVTIPLAKVTP